MLFGEVLLEDPIELLSEPQNLLCMNCDIRRLTRIASAGLMHHDTAMRKAEALLRLSAAEKQGTHGSSLSNTNGCHRRGDVGHSIVDGEAGGDAAAWGVDVERYGLFGIVGFEEKKLSDNGGGDGLVDFAIQTDNTFLEEFGNSFQ